MKLLQVGALTVGTGADKSEGYVAAVGEGNTGEGTEILPGQGA